MFRSATFSILGCLVISWHAFGQTATEETVEIEPSKRRQAWIMASSLPKDVESPIKVLIGDNLTEVKIMKRALGVPINVPKDGILHVVNPITISEGKPVYERYVSIKVPDGVKKSLVILFPVPDLPAPLKFKAHVIDLDKFRGGDALFVNLTNVEVGVTLGKKQTILKSGHIEMIDMENFEGKKNATVSYHYREANQKSWSLISASTTTLVSTRREILIFSYDNELKQIDYHGISIPGVD